MQIRKNVYYNNYKKKGWNICRLIFLKLNNRKVSIDMKDIEAPFAINFKVQLVHATEASHLQKICFYRLSFAKNGFLRPTGADV